MSVHEHKEEKIIAACFVITVSDSRKTSDDKSGRLIHDYLIDNGHRIVDREIVKDDPQAILEVVETATNHSDVDAIILNGGTGIAYRDVTIETIKPLFDKEIPGFGEIFRTLSYYEDISSAAILSRAIAGVCKHKAIFSVPGSSGAVKLAMEKLILPELAHIIGEIKKDI